MYGKLVNGELQAPPVEISRNIQKMRDAGFKPVMDNKPAHDINTQDAVFVGYVDRDIYIDVIYEVVEIEPTEGELVIEQTNKVMEMLNINLDDTLSNLSDEQALEVPNMFPKWKKDKKFKAGDRFFHDGKLYKVPEDYVEQEPGYFNSSLFTKITKEQVENMFDKVNDLFDKVNGVIDKIDKNKDKVDEVPQEVVEEEVAPEVPVVEEQPQDPVEAPIEEVPAQEPVEEVLQEPVEEIEALKKVKDKIKDKFDVN